MPSPLSTVSRVVKNENRIVDGRGRNSLQSVAVASGLFKTENSMRGDGATMAKNRQDGIKTGSSSEIARIMRTAWLEYINHDLSAVGL